MTSRSEWDRAEPSTSGHLLMGRRNARKKTCRPVPAIGPCEKNYLFKY